MEVYYSRQKNGGAPWSLVIAQVMMTIVIILAWYGFSQSNLEQGRATGFIAGCEAAGGENCVALYKEHRVD